MNSLLQRALFERVAMRLFRAVSLLLLACASLGYGADFLVETAQTVRMEAPFILAAGKPEADYYLGVDRLHRDMQDGQAVILTPVISSTAPLQVWVRVWWEGETDNRFTIGFGEGVSRTWHKAGFSGGWEWMPAAEPVTLNADNRTWNVIHEQGGFCIDGILVTDRTDAAPAGRIIAAGPRDSTIYFYDDFMRDSKAQGENLGEWQTLTGTWQQYKIADIQYGQKSSEPERSANGFALKGAAAAETPALALNGDTAWRNYRFKASVMAAGAGLIGLVFCWQDEANYYLFQAAAGEGEFRLERVRGGQRVCLAQAPGRLDAAGWYGLTAEAVNGVLTCLVDDTVVFTLRDSALLSGKVGLHVSGDAYGVFDDVFVNGVRIMREDFESWEYGRWNKVAGEWWVRWPRGSAGLFASLGETVPMLKADAGAVLVGRGPEAALVVIGEESWQTYEARAVIRGLRRTDAGGLVWNYRDPANYWLCQITPSDSTGSETGIELAVSQIIDGTAEVRERAPVPGGRDIDLKLRIANGSAVCCIADRNILKLADRSLTGGGFGLYARSPEGIDFDEVAIDFEPRRAPEGWDAVVPRFTQEDSMREWARESSDWLRGSDGLFRTIKDFYGDVGVEGTVNRPAENCILMIKNNQEEDGGYRAVFGLDGHKAGVVLSRAGSVVKETGTAAEITAEEWKQGVKLGLVKEGHYISCTLGDRIIAEYRDPDPLETGRRVGVGLPGMSQVENVVIASRNLMNYYFTHSPEDWYRRGGEWRITNRWQCDPRWSWFGGRGEGVAALWNKRELEGDFTIDLFMSMQMDVRGTPHYFHPGEMNISVCGDGENAGSGYSFVFGGERGIATRIYRRDAVVAETTEKLFLPPSTRDEWQPMEGPQGLHRRWFHLTVVRRGNLFEYFLDNNLMLNYADADPLPGRSFAIWTYDNGIMVARVRVSAETISARNTRLDMEELVPADTLETTTGIGLVSSTHPLAAENEQARMRWILRRSRQDALTKEFTARVEPVAYAGRETCLRLTNRTTGGKFSTTLFEGERPVSELRRLSFDYLIPDRRIKNDLFISTDRGWFCVRLTGDTAPYRPGTPPFYPAMLGTVPVAVDDQWHSAVIDLANLFAAAPGTQDPAGVIIKGVFIGYGSYGYTDAGLTGNFRGDAFYLDRVCFRAPGGDTFKAAWEAGDDSFAFLLDQQPGTLPDPAHAVPSGTFEDSNLVHGRHYFHISRPAAGEKPVITGHFLVEVDRKPPTVTDITITADQVQLDLADDLSGIDWSTLTLLAGSRKLDARAPGVAVDAANDRVHIDFARAGMALEPGTLNVSVVTLKDRAGNVLRESRYASRPYALADDHRPPELDFVLPDYMRPLRLDFETADQLWVSQVGDKASALLDGADAHRGKACMLLTHNSNATEFACAWPRPFNAAEIPAVSFWYRLEPDTRVNPVFRSAAGMVNVGFADKNRDGMTIGVIEGVERGTWQRAVFDLRAMLVSARDTIPSLDIRDAGFRDIGWLAADPMTRFRIDDFMLHPMYDNSKGTMTIGVVCRDASGLAELSRRFVPLGRSGSPSAWEVQPNPVPDAAGVVQVAIPSGIEGLFDLEVSAVDRAGNRADPVRLVLALDNTPPVLGTIIPEPEQRAAASLITVGLTDAAAGIKRKSIILNIDNVKYTLASPALTYSEKARTLTFDVSRRKGADTFPDKREVKVGLYAEDGVGHPVKNMWYWVMDYSLDRTPPPEPYVTCILSTAGLDTFENGMGSWESRSGDSGGLAELTDAASALGSRCLKVINRSGSGSHDCFITRQAFDGLDRRLVALDYRVPPGVQVDFLVLVDGTWYSIRFCGAENAYKRIGEVPCIADDRWHQAVFDLGAMLAAAFPGRDKVMVRNFLMGEWINDHNNPQGSCYYVDNFTLFRETERIAGRFGWQPVYDATGISGYVYAFTTDPAAVPALDAGNGNFIEIAPSGPGRWYFRLAARDNNGNLSPAGTAGPVEVR